VLKKKSAWAAGTTRDLKKRVPIATPAALPAPRAGVKPPYRPNGGRRYAEP
jgi:hypothetical protein